MDFLCRLSEPGRPGVRLLETDSGPVLEFSMPPRADEASRWRALWRWQRAELDSSDKIPGTYIPPHPGQDGKLCTVASCVATMDDRLSMPTHPLTSLLRRASP